MKKSTIFETKIFTLPILPNLEIIKSIVINLDGFKINPVAPTTSSRNNFHPHFV